MIEDTNILTIHNHNKISNPHEYYENFPSYVSKLFPSASGGLKIFDMIFQQNPSVIAEQDQTISSISFTAIIEDICSDGTSNGKQLLDVGFRPANSYDGVVHFISVKPITQVDGQEFYAVMVYKKMTDTPCRTYNMQVWLYSKEPYTKFRVTFIDFNSELWNDNLNRYKVTGSEKYPKYLRLDEFFKNNIENNDLGSFDESYSKDDSRNEPNYIMTYDGSGNSFVIYPQTKWLYIGSSSISQLDTINFSTDMSGIATNDEVKLNVVFFNDNTDLISTGTIDDGQTNKLVLKNSENILSTVKGNALILQYIPYYNKWLEISRNF